MLLLDENTPCRVWPLGRGLEVYNNHKDGLVRSAKGQTKLSVLVKPVNKTVLFETAEVDDQGVDS